ncbi:protoporphyrinogen oxidase [Candidatus Desantisbacteria bacterium]|nr:protoporphyrinogen oxidase [Candidatus Desantisbacteria bacterium]
MTLKNGLVELIDKLKVVIQNEVKIITGGNAVSIKKIIDKQKVSFDIELENNSISDIDIVIITTPAYTTGNLIKNFDDELSSVLLNFPYVSSATVSIGFKSSEVSHSLEGFGFLIPKTENHKIMATTWTSSKWPFRAPEDYVLLRGFMGGAANEKMAYLPENEMIQIVLDEWKKIMKISAAPVINETYKWIKSMPQYVMGHEKTVEKIETLASKHKGLIIFGNYLRGVGIADCIKNSELIANKVCDTL